MDYMLRTDTKEQMDQALIAASLVTQITNENNQIFLYPIVGVTIDNIGSITKATPVTTNTEIQSADQSEFESTVETITDTRWHTNIRVMFELTDDQIAALPVINPPPAIPYRIFA